MSCVTSSFVGVRANLAFRAPGRPRACVPAPPGARSCQVSTAIEVVVLARAEESAATPATGRRGALASFAAFVALADVSLPALAADALLSDFDADTKDLIARQRALLTRGEGDVAAYVAKADAYFAGYKWDHKGHTNSFSSIMNTDIVIREQYAYLQATGGQWDPRLSPADSPKGKVLEGYLRNAEQCVVRRATPSSTPWTRRSAREWKAIKCTQGLVAPAGERRASDARERRRRASSVFYIRVGCAFTRDAFGAEITPLSLSLLNPVRTIHATGWALPAAGSSVRRRP